MKNELLLLIPFSGGMGRERTISQGCSGEGAFGDHQVKLEKEVGKCCLTDLSLQNLSVTSSGHPRGKEEAKKLWGPRKKPSSLGGSQYLETGSQEHVWAGVTHISDLGWMQRVCAGGCRSYRCSRESCWHCDAQVQAGS